VSLFLLYLYLATGNEYYVEVGRRGLNFVMARGYRNDDGGLTWYAKEGEPTVTPYWRWGTAGLGMAILRYRYALDDDGYDRLLADLLPDTDRKYTIFPTRFFGLAGIAEFHLDMAAFGFDVEAALERAKKALSGILLFRMELENGVAFPGETLARISCDFGTGSAGIALTAHRYLQGGESSYLLDELLRGDRDAVQSRPSAQVAR